MELQFRDLEDEVRLAPLSITRMDGSTCLDFERERPFPASVETREASDPGEAWPRFVRDERVATRAGHRHMSRVGAVLRAVAEYVGSDVRDGERHDAIYFHAQDALAVLAMEIHGVGGPRGYGGDATRRMSWAKALGKGRKQATDGGAWSAAVESAKAVIESMSGVRVTPDGATMTVAAHVIPEDCGFAVAWAASQAVKASSPGDAEAWLEVARCALIEGTDQDRERWTLRIGSAPASAIAPAANDFE